MGRLNHMHTEVSGKEKMSSAQRDQTTKSEWQHSPELPIENGPLFTWPPNPMKIIKWYLSVWVALTERMFIVGIAFFCWFFLQPALERCVTFEFGWMFEIYARNLGLTVLLAGGLHLYFYTFQKQGVRRKFDLRALVKSSRTFTWNSQVKDNMFWTCASGVTIWSAYEILLTWAYANGYVPQLTWSKNPVWFIALFIVIPVWYSFHFYWAHRFLHWPPLYKLAHALHHRNINTGPWSGLSMHPIEHVLYFSSGFVFFLVPAHPVHIIYHMQYFSLAAITSHSGYETLLVKEKDTVQLGYFFHQLHHRYFECNYGTGEMPWDKWFGSFHDGTPEATKRIRERRARMHGTS